MRVNHYRYSAADEPVETLQAAAVLLEELIPDLCARAIATYHLERYGRFWASPDDLLCWLGATSHAHPHHQTLARPAEAR
jgi:hypothetical protein